MKKKRVASGTSTSILFYKQPIFPVAGIGASAGGLDAFKTLIKAIPENSGIAWVLVQHQDTAYESRLTELLQKVTSIPVIEITNNIIIKANHIYIMPARKMLTAKDGKLKLSPRPAKERMEGNYPIDLFFASLAQVYEGNAIGVVLSGTASDGTKGLKAIKDYGGITIAQSIASAAYADMPESAIAAGVVDFILAPEKIPKKLLEIKKIISINREDENMPEEEEKFFKEILSLLHIQRGMDFTYYKQTTIRRRILRRMVLNKFKKIADYITYLKENKNEIDALYQDMLIPVTGFFRDAKVFDNLCETVFPNLIKNKTPEGHIRIWVAGCSTGEEAYSIAICFKEYLGHKNEKVQIFATDLSEPAIAKARAGIYTKSEADTVSHQRLKKFFTVSHGNYLINKDLRDMCVFAVHNFLKEPPFGKIDFISCRNVLIYMDTYLQKKALTTFHYALNPHGLLMLGKSENTIGITDLFITNNKTEKIFTRKDVPSKIPALTNRNTDPVATPIKKSMLPETIRTDFQKMADEVIMGKYTPAAVVVNEGMEIVYFRGNTAFYLEQSPGKPTHNLLKMAKTGLAFELRSILHKTIKEKKAVKKENIPVQLQNAQQLISLEAIPLTGLPEPHWLIIFNDIVKVNAGLSSAKVSALNKKDENTLRLQQLEQEILQLREDMRSITEEQEASNEELQSTNEELLSSNEELQSLNEELETSKEELQSTIEELTVVNLEMVNLNEQLATEKDYAEAIIATIPQPMLVLDKDLRVTVANQLFYQKFLVAQNQTEGKLVYDIGNRQWDIPELRTLLEGILPQKESFFGFEVEHNFELIGHRIIRLNAREIAKEKGEKRILLVIEDVTDYVQAARTIEESEHRYANMIYSSPFMIAILERKDMIIKDANATILAAWGAGKEVIGKSLYKIRPEIIESGRHKMLDKVFETGEPYYGYEVPVETIRNGQNELLYYTFIYQAQKNIDGKIEGVAILANEVTPQAALNKKIKESEEKFQAAVSAVQGIVWTNNAKGEMEGEQLAWASLTGQTYNEYQGYGWSQAVHPDDAGPTVIAWQQAVSNQSTFIFEHRVRVKDNTWRLFSIRAIPLKNADGSTRGWVGVHTDITEKRQAEIQLKESEEQFRVLSDQAPMWVWLTDTELNILYANTELLKFIGIAHSREFTGKIWEQKVYPGDIELVYQAFREAVSMQKSFAFECRIQNAGTSEYEWFYIKGVPRYEANEFAGFIGTGINIQEQKNTLSQLEYRKALLEAHNEASIDGILLVDTKGKILSYNHRFVEIWNMPQHIVDAKDDEAALAFALTQLVNPGQFMEKVKWLYDNPNEISVDELEFKNGKIIERHGYPVAAADGSYYAWSWMFRDITEQRKYERAIKESEERYHQLIVSSPSAIGVLKGEGLVITTANDAIIEIWGKGREIMGKPYFEALPELAEQGYKEVFANVYKTGQPFNAIETPVHILQNGTMQLKYYNFLLYAQQNIYGVIDGIGIIATEVTSQALFNKQIQESEKRFRLLADSMPQHIWTADAQGNLNYFNQSVFDYSGLSAEQILRDGWLQIVHPDDREENIRQWTSSVTQGTDFLFEHRFKRYDGEYRWQLSRAVPQKDADGNITMWVGTSTDIQKIKEEEKRKDDFLKMVSHELKTPVTSIKGYVQFVLSMLKEGADTPAWLSPVKSSLVRIDIQVIRLTRLITEMLDLSRIESGKLELQRKQFSLNDLVVETIQDISHTNTTHTINLHEDSQYEVTADRDRLGQVLINFINNAIKYSPESNSVEVNIFKPAENQAAVSVKDFGIGISKEDQAKIFERFYRVSGKNEEVFSGFGIGLFIANEIIQRHHGSIIVESDTGKGSIFTFIIPLHT